MLSCTYTYNENRIYNLYDNIQCNFFPLLSRKVLTVRREVFQPEAAGDADQYEERGEDDEGSVGFAGLVRSLIF